MRRMNGDSGSTVPCRSNVLVHSRQYTTIWEWRRHDGGQRETCRDSRGLFKVELRVHQTSSMRQCFSVATPAEPRGEKKTLCANFGRWKTFKTCWKVPVKHFSAAWGATFFSNAFWIVFRIFSRFSNRFSYRFKSFSGTVSFCRHAALTMFTMADCPTRPLSRRLSQGCGRCCLI